MNLGRTVLSATLAFTLVACGGDDDSSGTPPNFGGGADSCSLSARQDWAFGVLDEWYLFPDDLDRTVNKANYDTVQGYIDALVADAGIKDRGFTYLTSIEEENDLINNGSNAGFGIRLTYDSATNGVYVAEAFENGNAFKAGFDRGTRLISIDGQSVSTLLANNTFNQALGPSEPGVSRTFVIRDLSGAEKTVTVTKSEYSLDPISDRYGVKILADGAGGQVGYINLRTFIVQDAGPQLRDAFQQFQSQGIDRVVLDFRYNGGGLVSVAELLGDLLGEGLEGQVFSRTELRPSKAAENSTELFEQQAQQISTMKLAVIGTDSTASASELVANSMIPYLGDNIALVGSNTYGKPVGQFAFDRSACDDRLRAVAFKTVNANGQGEYYSGLASVMPNTCRAGDDIFRQLGDPAEASVSVAIDFLAGRTCTPMGSTGKDQTVQSVGNRKEFLRPNAPSAAQREIPGLF